MSFLFIVLAVITGILAAIVLISADIIIENRRNKRKFE